MYFIELLNVVGVREAAMIAGGGEGRMHFLEETNMAGITEEKTFEARAEKAENLLALGGVAMECKYEVRCDYMGCSATPLNPPSHGAMITLSRR